MQPQIPLAFGCRGGRASVLGTVLAALAIAGPVPATAAVLAEGAGPVQVPPRSVSPVPVPVLGAARSTPTDVAKPNDVHSSAGGEVRSGAWTGKVVRLGLLTMGSSNRSATTTGATLRPPSVRVVHGGGSVGAVAHLHGGGIEGGTPLQVGGAPSVSASAGRTAAEPLAVAPTGRATPSAAGPPGQGLTGGLHPNVVIGIGVAALVLGLAGGRLLGHRRSNQRR